MELNGLIYECSLLTNIAINSNILLLNSKEAQICKNSQQDLYTFLKKVYHINNALLIIKLERVILDVELQNRSNSKEEINSTKVAIPQIDVAIDACSIVLQSDVYSTVARSYAEKQKKNGLPQDAVCVFIQSHIARLNNKLSDPLSIPEKNVIRQRKENIQKARELYTELQRQALGLPSLEKTQTLSR